MAEMILPGVYIEERAEALIVPGRVTVGTLGVVGTASKGPIGEPKLLGSYTEAREVFGDYDPWVDGTSAELTLVRALQLAFAAGATRAFAVRVSSMTADIPPEPNAMAATFTLAGELAGETVAVLTAEETGTWGNSIGVNVWDAEDDAFLQEKTVADGVALIKLKRASFDAVNVRSRVKIKVAATSQTKLLTPMPADPPNAAVTTGKFRINTAAGHEGELMFHDDDKPKAGDIVVVSYVVPKAHSRKVTLRYGNQTKVYTIADGNHLVELLANPDAPPALAGGSAGTNPDKLPQKNAKPDEFLVFGQPPDASGSDGADAIQGDYAAGLAKLLTERAHIIVAAGQSDDTFWDDLANHCDIASTDLWQKDRIAVVGSRVKATFDQVRGHDVNSDRVIFVAPGIKATDAASRRTVTLPGAYTAAVVAGMLSARAAHISLTNKPVQVDELETKFTTPQLEELVNSRVLAVEERRGLGIRIVQGLTTDPGAFRQITTRRIVDYAKYGVRSAAEPYIGLLNNERVRGALRATVNSFLAEMVDDEMLIKYTLEVTATRDEERKGICRVTMTLQPTFSIDYIKVTMFLE